MEAFFFGPTDRQLYGVYHPPRRTRGLAEGVVLCYPMGQEYIRIHRAFRWLADQLSAHGFHVLRFDYTGQGNSSGSFTTASLAQWQRDAQHAVSELADATGVETVDVVGLRVGTLIAAQAARHSLVRRVVCWEPRESGAAFRRELLGDDSSGAAAVIDQPDGTVARFGFPYTSALLDELASTPFVPLTSRSRREALVVSASRLGSLDAWTAACEHAGVPVGCRVVDSAENWNSIDDMGGLYLPLPTMQSIVEWLHAEG